MTRTLAVIAAALVVVTVPAKVSAGVDVNPADLRPELYIESERKSSGSFDRTTAPAGPERKKHSTPLRICRVDPEVGIYGCRRVDPDPDDDEAELTEGDILRAVREIGLPSLKVRIQPGEETLVNIETIFYTQPQPFERSITLLGFDIDLVASPVRYTWVHDDGTVSTTSRPGKPYPAMDVTHRYREPAEDVRPRVDVTYRVRYRVDGGAWQTIGQTLQASGPAAELDVREAAPVLTRP